FEQHINVSNQNLKAATAQYQQARAALRYNRADYYPTITANPSASRNRYSNNRPPQTSIFNGTTLKDYTLPLDLSYHVNAWGRLRAVRACGRDTDRQTSGRVQSSTVAAHNATASDTRWCAFGVAGKAPGYCGG